MKRNPKPIYKNGDRNLFCAYYSNCLDYAAKRHWKYWACLNCHHQFESQPSVHGPITTEETVIYYSLPQEIYQKVV